MATLPYIQLYVSDYLADTQHLSAEEHGAYLLLIMNYWQTEKPIPENRLQGITRMFNERWTNVKSVLSDFFEIDDNGAWYHKRINQDLEKVKQKSKQASEAGKKSAQIRALKKSENKEDIKVCSTDVQQKSNGRSTIKDKREKIKDNIPTKKPKCFVYPLDFEKLWKTYNNGDKWAGFKSWNFRIKDYPIEHLILVLEAEKKKAYGQRHFSTVLNGDIDEIASSQVATKKQKEYLI